MTNQRVLLFLSKTFSAGSFWFCLALATAVGVFLYETFNQDIMAQVNGALWVVTSLILFAGYIALTFYVIIYGLVFDWAYLPPVEGARTRAPNVGGRLIFNLTASLEGVVLLLVLQLFVVPPSGRPWWVAPPEAIYWLPTLRFVVYTWVVVSIFAMAATLVRRIVDAEALEIAVPTRAGERSQA